MSWVYNSVNFKLLSMYSKQVFLKHKIPAKVDARKLFCEHRLMSTWTVAIHLICWNKYTSTIVAEVLHFYPVYLLPKVGGLFLYRVENLRILDLNISFPLNTIFFLFLYSKCTIRNFFTISRYWIKLKRVKKGLNPINKLEEKSNKKFNWDKKDMKIK